MLPNAAHFESTTTPATLRLGAVSYLNSKPLIWQLPRIMPDARRSLDLPSRLADSLACGQLDVALIPIVEHFRQSDTHLLSSACVACRGPVWSVKIYFRTQPRLIRSLALDEGSRTSAALAQILLAEHGAFPKGLVTLPIGWRPEQSEADAVLVIGDRAMHRPTTGFVDCWDLGQKWYETTGLPFVFAAWVARSNVADAESIASQLNAARDAGVASIDEIAKIESLRVGLTEHQAKDYLSNHLRYHLGPEEQRAIALFRDACQTHGHI
jgi:chorismate dehydratase